MTGFFFKKNLINIFCDGNNSLPSSIVEISNYLCNIHEEEENGTMEARIFFIKYINHNLFKFKNNIYII